MTKLDIAKALLLQMKEPERVCVRYRWSGDTLNGTIITEEEYHRGVPEGEHDVWMSHEWKDKYTPTRYYEELKEVRRLLADIEREWGFNK